jgi:NAD(P)-dependent dehydrogenase (short-subunit alcohol dehydrogenase family)
VRLLENKRVLVTGAGSNVGRAVCALFAEHGAALAAADLDERRAREAATGAAGHGAPTPAVVQADLTSAGDCERMVRDAVAALGGIDVLCNTAGIDPPGAAKAHETSEADWDRILAVNLKGTFLSCKYVLPVMLAQHGGAIVNVASQGALLTLPAMTAYGVSKAGVLQLTRQIAADYAREGIRANCVCPSGLELPSLDRLARLQPGQLERRAEVMKQAVPLGRVCTPADVAAAMLFLASGLSGFTTGAALPVEGGATTVLRF